jgi:hypothetical protein
MRKKFKNSEEWARRKYVLQEQRLAPSGVGADNIRDKSFVLRTYADIPNSLRSAKRDLVATQITMNSRGRQCRRGIAEIADCSGFTGD